MTRIAVLQMTSGVVPEENFRTIERAATEAGEGGASILFTPEMSLLLDRNRKRGAATIADSSYAQFPERLYQVAVKTGVDIALGSMPVRSGEKLANRAYYFSASAAEPVTYDKMHMFDVDLATGESWRESNAYSAGEKAVVVEDTPLGRLGLTICYDLRFPALFDVLGKQRCDCISIPAAFTVPTGQAHWHVLQRARAIEASAFVIAAAQVGEHQDGRTTYGHSLVIDPWGEVLLDMGVKGAGLGFAKIDLSRIKEVRQQVPSLANRREIDK